MLGSSPLARGTPHFAACDRWCRGLIPARAGNTEPGLWIVQASGAHPRSRGEHGFIAALASSEQGSSPLARGTLFTGEVKMCHAGLIPARAGNTRARARAGRRNGAHPRSRGEHSGESTRPVADEGSSPLARGTLVRPVWDGIQSGLIPARAGNTPVLGLR